jgi:trans-aconitate methyltransferase
MTPHFGERFDASSAGFVAWSPGLWEPLGHLLVKVASPRQGERVLDARCGAGASALPAATAVGTTGRVDGVDLTERLLDHARRKAGENGLHNVRFRCADVTTWRPDSGPYDLVQCGHGVHLLADMIADGRHLVSLLRPGGRLAVATTAVGGFEPLVTLLGAAAARERADGENLANTPRPAERINTVDKLHGYLETVGLSAAEVISVPFRISLDTPRPTWALVTGSALRFLLAGLPPDAIARVRADVLAELEIGAVTELDIPTLVGVGYNSASSAPRRRPSRAVRHTVTGSAPETR